MRDITGTEEGGASIWSLLITGVALATLVALFFVGQQMSLLLAWGPILILLLIGLIPLAMRLARRGDLLMKWALWLGPVAFLAMLGGCMMFMRANNPIPQLLEDGRAIVQILEEQKQENSAYPFELPPIADSALARRFGGWQYGTTGVAFTLTIGDYSRDEFTIWYEPERGWYTDT